jgi:homocysteine S-methyltransferase
LDSSKLALFPNASRKSHEELNNSTELDDGNPEEFGRELKEIKDLWPHLRVFGGCCGTDLRHIEKVCEACFS